MYRIGMEVTGVVTGIQNYGVFVSIDDDTQGLIHISEIKHGYIKNIHDLLKVGDEITVKIVDIDEYTQKMSLSLRAMEDYHGHRQQKKQYFTNRHQKIGFKSIEKQLDSWVKGAMEDLTGNDEI